MVQGWRFHRRRDLRGYTPIAEDVGSTLSVRVTYFDGAGTFESIDSAASAPVAPPTFPGTELANLMTGTTAAERFDARGGNDWINAGGGSDTVDGGAGRDMLSLYNVPDTPGRTNVQYRLEVDMGAGTSVSHDGAERITFSGIERFTASIYADRIRGSDGDDEIRGLGDYDWFIATRGNDSIDGGTGQDMISFLEYQSGAANVIGDIFGSNGLPPTGAQVSGLVVDLADPTNNTELAAGLELTSVERVTGSVRQDVFWGDDGQNDFRGLGDFDWFVSSEGGRERYFGGNGFDTVTYFNAASGIVASLSNGATVNGQETGFGDGGVARGDLYFEIENLVGSRFADRLTGSSERNQLNGLEGDDFIFGQGNTDYMKGGAGNDVIDGGDGADYALFSGNSDRLHADARGQRGDGDRRGRHRPADRRGILPLRQWRRHHMGALSGGHPGRAFLARSMAGRARHDLSNRGSSWARGPCARDLVQDPSADHVAVAVAKADIVEPHLERRLGGTPVEPRLERAARLSLLPAQGGPRRKHPPPIDPEPHFPGCAHGEFQHQIHPAVRRHRPGPEPLIAVRVIAGHDGKASLRLQVERERRRDLRAGLMALHEEMPPALATSAPEGRNTCMASA